MSRYDREPSTVMVTPLELADDETSALEWLRAHAQVDIDLGKEGVQLPDDVRVSPTWGIVVIGDEVWALCTEGVGPNHPITDEQQCTFEVFIRSYEDGGEFIPMFAACSFKLGPAELRERATGEPVPLHDFVRVFGGRLEANYASWRRLLEQRIQEVPA